MKNLEKLCVMMLFCFSALWSQSLFGQTVAPPSGATAPKKLHLHFTSGFNTFKLGRVKDFYGLIVNRFRIANVPLPTQRKFPGNLVLGVEALYHYPSGFNVGLGLRYTRTRAFSLYADYAGELDVIAKVEMLSLETILQKDLSRGHLFKPFVGIRGGLLAGRSEFALRISFEALDGPSVAETISDDGIGYSIEGFLGTKYDLKRFILSAQAGYRYAKVPSDLEIDFSGIVLDFGIGFSLSR